MFTFIGTHILRFLSATGAVCMLAVEVARCVPRLPREAEVWFKQLRYIGVETLPIALLMGAFIGMIVALQTGYQLLQFQIEGIVGAVVGLSLAKEMGPVLTGYLVAGRVGAAMTAEIGTMAVSEEIDAIKVMGVDPVEYLAMPRVLAALIMTPMLTMYVLAIGCVGGALISQSYLGVGWTEYFDNLFEQMTTGEIVRGLVKALTFGGIIGLVGCHKGFTTKNGAEGVGRNTTQSVVLSFILIVTADYLLSHLMVLEIFN